MCLGEVVQVVEVPSDGEALARIGSRVIPVSLITLDGQVSPGDWLVMHSGFAMARLSPDEADEALAIRRHTYPG